MIKLTIIGAGSAVFTKNIVTDLLSVEAFKNMEIALQDIDPDTGPLNIIPKSHKDPLATLSDFNVKIPKNLIELTGNAWCNKIVGFMCSAGGRGSYMSPMSFMNSLMLDFRCIIIPRFVYDDGSSIDENNNLDDQLKDRIEELVDLSISLSKKIAL